MSRRLAVYVGALGTLFGCTRPMLENAWPEPAPLGREIAAGQLAGAPGGPGARASTVEDEPTGPLTLRRALELALAGNPAFAAVSWRVRAAEARAIQAHVRPNPELELRVEEFGGSSEASGFGASTATLAFGQEIELGGKRAKRTRVAGLETRLAAWDYEAMRLDLITETRVAFADVLAAQQEVALARDTVDLTERTLEVVSERVEAGKVSPLEAMRSEVELSTDRVGLERARRKLRTARESLAGKWGATAPAFERADGALDELGDIPPLESLLRLANRNPDIARWQDEITLREERIGLVRANRTPNLNVSAGVQRLAEADETAFIVSVAIPLPISNRNRGAILAAERELHGVRAERRAADVKVRTALRRAYHELSSVRQEAVSLSETVLPAARRAHEAATEGYRQGKFGFLQVLGAQRTLVQVRGQRIQAVEAYHKAIAELERLVGTDLESVERSGEGTRPRSDRSDPGAQPTP